MEVTLSEVILTWNPVPSATGYEVQYGYADGSRGWYSSHRFGVDANPRAVFTSELGSHEYMFRVRAESNGGAELGPWSETLTAFRW